MHELVPGARRGRVLPGGQDVQSAARTCCHPAVIGMVSSGPTPSPVDCRERLRGAAPPACGCGAATATLPERTLRGAGLGRGQSRPGAPAGGSPAASSGLLHRRARGRAGRAADGRPCSASSPVHARIEGSSTSAVARRDRDRHPQQAAGGSGSRTTAFFTIENEGEPAAGRDRADGDDLLQPANPRTEAYVRGASAD